MINEQITSRVHIIQRVYVMLACLAIFGFTIGITRPSKKESFELISNSLILTFIYIAAYIGLKKQRNWTIPLILLTSIFELVKNLLSIIEPAINKMDLLAKVVQFFILYFYWYQAFFFSRREVKHYFGSNGIILF